MTLLELAVVATFAGLLLGIFVPKISSFREQMLLDSTAQELARDVIRARGEALKRNESVSVTFIDDAQYKVRTEAPRRLPHGLNFKAGFPAEVRFTPFGLVSAGVGSTTITTGTYERKVTVRTTGHVRVE